jgi:hypothetical protein
MRERRGAATLGDMTIDPRELIVTSRQRRLEGGQPPHLDADLTRIRRGYYRAVAEDLTPSAEYRLRIHACADVRVGTLVFSHASAAELWGCPLLNSDTRLVHCHRPGKARRTTAATQTHRGAIPEEHIVTTADGLLVASREWTALQLACQLPLPNVLLPLDHLLRDLNPDPDADPAGAAVAERLVQMLPRGTKGRARAERHLRLADARSGSAGESLSRGQMVLLNVPPPQLQTRFPRGDQPGEDVVDFDWEQLGVFGEFDGKVKYTRDEMTQGRSPAEIVWDEKIREDRIRRHRPHAARWGWDTAMSRPRLARVLALAGVHPVPRNLRAAG